MLICDRCREPLGDDGRRVDLFAVAREPRSTTRNQVAGAAITEFASADFCAACAARVIGLLGDTLRDALNPPRAAPKPML